MKGQAEIIWTRSPSFVSDENLNAALNMMDREEKDQFYKYAVPHKRIEFMLGRYIVKTYLGCWLGVPPCEISFTKNKYGKLYLKENLRPEKGLYFNLSHTDEVVACGFSSRELGLDVENTADDYFEIMPHVYCRNEMNYIEGQLTGEAKNRAFYEIWTKKEAVMKSEGKGFSMKPLSFSVPPGMEGCVDQFFYYHTTDLNQNHILSAVLPNVDKAEIQIQYVSYQDLFSKGL